MLRGGGAGEGTLGVVGAVDESGSVERVGVLAESVASEEEGAGSRGVTSEEGGAEIDGLRWVSPTDARRLTALVPLVAERSDVDIDPRLGDLELWRLLALLSLLDPLSGDLASAASCLPSESVLRLESSPAREPRPKKLANRACRGWA